MTRAYDAEAWYDNPYRERSRVLGSISCATAKFRLSETEFAQRIGMAEGELSKARRSGTTDIGLS